MNIGNYQGIFNNGNIDYKNQNLSELNNEENSVFNYEQSEMSDPDDIYEVADFDFDENFEYDNDENSLKDKLDLLYEDLASARSESDITSIKENISGILNKLIDSGDINDNSVFQL